LIEYWSDLTDKKRKDLVKLDKDLVLKKLKEQQKYSCSCSVCGRRRTVVEEELEMIYEAYFEELEKRNESTQNANGISFGNCLKVKDGILTVCEDLLKKEKIEKFLEMIEQIGEMRPNSFSDLEDSDYDSEDDESEQEISEYQRVVEGRRKISNFYGKNVSNQNFHCLSRKSCIRKSTKFDQRRGGSRNSTKRTKNKTSIRKNAIAKTKTKRTTRKTRKK